MRNNTKAQQRAQVREADRKRKVKRRAQVERNTARNKARLAAAREEQAANANWSVKVYASPDFDVADHIIIDLNGEIDDDGDLVIGADTDCGVHEIAFCVPQDELQRVADLVHAKGIASWETAVRGYAREVFRTAHVLKEHYAAYEKGYVQSLHDCGEFERFALNSAVEGMLDNLKQTYVKMEEVA